METPLDTALMFCVYVLAVAVPACRIVSRRGFNGAWSLLSLLPGLNVLGPWLLAFSRWPRRCRRDAPYPDL